MSVMKEGRRAADVAGNVGHMAAGNTGLGATWPWGRRRTPDWAWRLWAQRVAMLGTVRGDGSPRISPVEPYLADGCLLIDAWPGRGTQQTCAAIRGTCSTAPWPTPTAARGTEAARARCHGERGPSPRGGGRVVVRSVRGQGCCVRPGYRPGPVRRVGHRAWRDDGSPVVPAGRLSSSRSDPPVADQPSLPPTWPRQGGER
jgi:hypothetical protein